MNSKKIKQPLYRLAAPVLLMVIACLQLYLAHVHDLTPWKGGGFGMFCTVDSRGARFLRIYLMTDEGETPVKIPRHLYSQVREVRSIPTAERLERLATELAQATWVPLEYDPFEPYISPSEQSSLSEDQVPANDNSAAVSDEETQFPPAEDGLPRFKALENGILDSESEYLVKIDGVRVELWRFGFNSSTTEVIAYKFREVTAKSVVGRQ